MTEKILMLKSAVKAAKPLVHCITNPISINQCANAVLAVGGRPIMAEHPLEVGEITGASSALVLNLGNITDVRMESVKISAAVAKEKGIPIILDPVGVACSSLRRNFAKELMSTYTPDLVKGNYSEINALYSSEYSSSGVDTDSHLDTLHMVSVSNQLAADYGTVVLTSGQADIVTDGKVTFLIHNGTPQLAGITGTGCMLGAVCGCYFSAATDISSAVAACVHLGISGELSETGTGSGSFAVNLIDKLSVLSDDDITEYIRVEEIPYETV